MPTPMPVLNIPSTAAQPGNNNIAISKRVITLRLPGCMFFILLVLNVNTQYRNNNAIRDTLKMEYTAVLTLEELLLKMSMALYRKQVFRDNG
jgi:hypothetical protein